MHIIDELKSQLDTYITRFMERNYPLSKADMRAIVNGETNYNINQRKAALECMKNSENAIIDTVTKNNKAYLDALSRGMQVPPLTKEKYEQLEFNCKQRMLEDLYKFRKNQKYKSKIVSQNEEALRYAANNGLSGEALRNSFGNIIEESEKRGIIPPQLETSKAVVSGMKHGDFNKALEEGISNEEFNNSFENALKKSNTGFAKDKLAFSTRFVSTAARYDLEKSKKKENTNENTNERGYQYQYVKSAS